MSDKVTIARIKKFGQNFELNVDSDKALAYRKGELNSVRDALLSDEVFTDVKKGLRATSDSLVKAFETDSIDTIADVILKKGEIQLSSEHRAAEREQKRKKLIHFIHIQAVDPNTGFPHPETRIDAALNEAKVHIDDNKSVEEQIDGIISKLRPIIPIKIEQKKISVTIPGTYAGKAYQPVTSAGKVVSEDWKSDGSWQVVLEIPAGLYPKFIDTVNSLTHGECVVEEI